MRNTPGKPKRPIVFPVPACSRCVTEPWVVLASVVLPQAARSPAKPVPGRNGAMEVSYQDRRVLLSSQHLQTAMLERMA